MFLNGGVKLHRLAIAQIQVSKYQIMRRSLLKEKPFFRISHVQKNLRRGACHLSMWGQNPHDMSQNSHELYWRLRPTF